MKQQRLHYHRPAAPDLHVNLSARLLCPTSLVCCQAPQAMGPGHNTKRTISLVAIIEMEPKGQYVLEQGRRRLNEQFALLFGPTLPRQKSQQLTPVGLQPVESCRVERLGLGETFSDRRLRNEISCVLGQVALLAQLIEPDEGL